MEGHCHRYQCIIFKLCTSEIINNSITNRSTSIGCFETDSVAEEIAQWVKHSSSMHLTQVSSQISHMVPSTPSGVIPEHRVRSKSSARHVWPKSTKNPDSVHSTPISSQPSQNLAGHSTQGIRFVPNEQCRTTERKVCHSTKSYKTIVSAPLR